MDRFELIFRFAVRKTPFEFLDLMIVLGITDTFSCLACSIDFRKFFRDILHGFGDLASGLFPGFFSEFAELGRSSIGIHIFLHQMELMHRNVYLFVPGVFEHHEFIL